MATGQSRTLRNISEAPQMFVWTFGVFFLLLVATAAVILPIVGIVWFGEDIQHAFPSTARQAVELIGPPFEVALLLALGVTAFFAAVRQWPKFFMPDATAQDRARPLRPLLVLTTFVIWLLGLLSLIWLIATELDVELVAPLKVPMLAYAAAIDAVARATEFAPRGAIDGFNALFGWTLKVNPNWLHGIAFLTAWMSQTLLPAELWPQARRGRLSLLQMRFLFWPWPLMAFFSATLDYLLLLLVIAMVAGAVSPIVIGIYRLIRPQQTKREDAGVSVEPSNMRLIGYSLFQLLLPALALAIIWLNQTLHQSGVVVR